MKLGQGIAPHTPIAPPLTDTISRIEPNLSIAFRMASRASLAVPHASFSCGWFDVLPTKLSWSRVRKPTSYPARGPVRFLNSANSPRNCCSRIVSLGWGLNLRSRYSFVVSPYSPSIKPSGTVTIIAIIIARMIASQARSGRGGLFGMGAIATWGRHKRLAESRWASKDRAGQGSPSSHGWIEAASDIFQEM